MDELLGAILVYVGLAVVSSLFNGYIDERPPLKRPDGMTAQWVAMGVGYTLLGGTVLVWLGFGWLLMLANAAGYGVAAAAVLLVYLSAFVVSGAPMAWADAHRSYRVRALDAALSGGQAGAAVAMMTGCDQEVEA